MIARLKKERDEARSLLAQAERQIPMSASATTVNASALSNGKRGLSHFQPVLLFNVANLHCIFCWFLMVVGLYIFILVTTAAEEEELGPDGKRARPGISASIIAELTDCNAALSQQRKRRQVLRQRYVINSDLMLILLTFVA